MKSIFLLIALSMWGNTFSQENNQEYPTTIISDSKKSEFINQAFLNCQEYTSSDYIQVYNEWMSRVIIHHIPLNLYPECPLLSSLMLKNKCNNGFSYQFTTIENFNPLMYHMQFETNITKYFRIDGKPYIVEIKAKNN